jgi:predicted NBD/HSP70 family sugar kinase
MRGPQTRTAVHGRAVRTTEADLRDFAHQILDPGGPMCPSGHRGCGTSFVSTASMLMAAAQSMRRFPAYEEVMGLAAAGDPVCSQVVRQAARALGILVANVTNTTMVKTVILAGEAVDIAHVAREDFDRGMAARSGNSGGIRLAVRPTTSRSGRGAPPWSRSGTMSRDGSDRGDP